MDKLDLLVFGATGFTGNLTVKFLAELVKKPGYQNISWGIAGRSPKKLEGTLTELTDLKLDTSTITVIECDVNDEKTLRNATSRTKVLLNCIGPLALLGEAVIKSCIETKTHYVDISAELPHMLALFRDHHKSAEEAGVLIVPSCGLASLPSAAGLIYLEKQFKGTPDVVDCYYRILIPKRTYLPTGNHCLVNSGTWESLVCVLQDLPKYGNMKKEMFPEPLDQDNKVVKRSFYHRHNGETWFPYPGPDDGLIELSQRYLADKYQKKPIHFNSYTTMPRFYHFIIIPPMYFYYHMSRFEWFRNMLSRNPKVFTLGYMTHQGPTEDTRQSTKYSLTMTGKSWNSNAKNFKEEPEKTVTIKVSGTDPGYYTTALGVVMSAITILRESDKMPKGGVLMPAAAFQNTNIVESLMKCDMKFEVTE